MDKQRLIVTMKDMQRYKVLQEVIEKKLKGTEAAEILKLTPVHVSRLKTRLSKEGFEGILRKAVPVPPNKKITEEMIKEIIRVRKDFYYDFNIMHFKDKLEENHNIHLCYESLRQILVQIDDHHPKKKKKVHRQRRRMPKAGMLVQMDSSQHHWLAHIPSKWWLIAMIDDATNEVPYAKLFSGDTVFTNMQVIRRFLELKGVFMSLYADKASHFKTTRYGSLHVDINQEQDDTQIERALEELGITLIPANSPQAKGRIERRFRLFQDRFIKEMRLAGIKDYDEANKFLQEKFLPWHNKRYMLEAEGVYMPLPKEKNLDLVFCIKQWRTVRKDNTISLNGQIIQIAPSNIKLSFAKTKVQVCQLEDNRIFVLHKNKVIAECTINKNTKIAKRIKKIEKLLNQREYIKPKKKHWPEKGHTSAPDHPWRMDFAVWEKKRQLKETRLNRSRCLVKVS
ncbi:MAG: ISNCY family transposase [Candidatus Margulisbacteria bacterium]|nr:ISNCY family transposase [Candidatus Margulisiibacteriota bacterium]